MTDLDCSSSLQSGGIKHALNPDPYRGRFGNDGPAYAEDVRDLIQTATSGQVAGFISETIQGVGGATPLADGYLAESYKVGLMFLAGQCKLESTLSMQAVSK